MTRGVLLVANNNESIDYIMQACFSANRIKKYLKLPVSLITDTPDIIKTDYTEYFDLFDNVIGYSPTVESTTKIYRDGQFKEKQLNFKNSARVNVFDLSPYDETIVLDTDIIIFNDCYLKCFEQKHDFLIYKNAMDLGSNKMCNDFKFISDPGIEFYWATCIFFRKNKENKIFFDLLQHIQENWDHYRLIYHILSGVYRNDFAFSIAIHMINGQTQGDFAKEFPGKLMYSTDRSELVKMDENSILLLLDNPNKLGSNTPMRLTNTTVHFMNKFSLDRFLKNDN
jgi:hypothetical protein